MTGPEGTIGKPSGRMDEARSTQQPQLQQQMGGSWLLWFKERNRYTILEPGLKAALELFFASRDEDEFSARMQQEAGDELLDARVLYQELAAFLSVAHGAPESDMALAPPSDFHPEYCTQAKVYTVNHTAFRVHYQDEAALGLVHYALANYMEGTEAQAQAEFWLYAKGGYLHLFQDGDLVQAVDERQYHYIQGKFLMRVISLVHGIPESGWVGTLHASAVVRNGAAILLAGQSGRGKSTLTTLLVSGGFELLADDITPLAASLEVFHNPSAVSIKKGAFPVVGRYFEAFESCPEVFVNASKGTVKYLPLPRPEQLHYPCKAFVLVDYQEGAATLLRPVAPAEVLQHLIPDSWISPEPRHARAFLDWLGGLQFYQLTYSSAEGAIQAVRALSTQP